MQKQKVHYLKLCYILVLSQMTGKTGQFRQPVQHGEKMHLLKTVTTKQHNLQMIHAYLNARIFKVFEYSHNCFKWCISIFKMKPFFFHYPLKTTSFLH